MIGLGSVAHALPVNEVYRRIEYTITLENFDLSSVVELARANKEVLRYQDAGILIQLVEYHKNFVKLKEQQEKIQDESLRQFNVEVLKKRSRAIEDLFVQLLEVGQGDAAFEADIRTILGDVELEDTDGFFVSALKSRFPKQCEDPNAPKYVPPKAPKKPKVKPYDFDDSDIVKFYKAARFQERLYKLRNFSSGTSLEVEECDLRERDLDGKSLMSYLVEQWHYTKIRKHKGNVRYIMNGRRYTKNEYLNMELENFIGRIITNNSDVSKCDDLFGDLMDTFCEDGADQKYGELIAMFEVQFPGELAKHRRLGLNGSGNFVRPIPPVPTNLDRSAYYTANIFQYIDVDTYKNKDIMLTNSFTYIKQYPSLANAHSYEGIPLLLEVMHLHSRIAEHMRLYSWSTTKEESKLYYLEAFFKFLLLNGADIDRKYEYQNGDDLKNRGKTSKFYKKYYTSSSVREILNDPSAYGEWMTHYKRLSDDTVGVFRKIVEDFEAHKKTGSQDAFGWLGDHTWLKERMPKAAQPPGQPDPTAQEQTQQTSQDTQATRDLLEQIKRDQELKRLDHGRPFWEALKHRSKPYLLGTLACGALYWYFIYDPEDPLEIRAQQRAQRASSAA